MITSMLDPWIRHFEANRAAHTTFTPPTGRRLPGARRVALASSLARFQLGESGDGKTLKRGAARYRDPELSRAIDLFLAEEQGHARLLADVVTGLGGQLLTRHWTDWAFVSVRRCAGFRGELMVLLIAEILGLLYYEAIGDSVRDDDEELSLILLDIHQDEVHHLGFHCAWLGPRLQALPAPVRVATRLAWSGVFRAAVRVMTWDHRKALKAAGVSPSRFRRRASALFDRVASRLFAHDELTEKDYRMLARLTP